MHAPADHAIGVAQADGLQSLARDSRPEAAHIEGRMVIIAEQNALGCDVNRAGWQQQRGDQQGDDFFNGE